MIDFSILFALIHHRFSLSLYCTHFSYLQLQSSLSLNLSSLHPQPYSGKSNSSLTYRNLSDISAPCSPSSQPVILPYVVLLPLFSTHYSQVFTELTHSLFIVFSYELGSALGNFMICTVAADLNNG